MLTTLKMARLTDNNDNTIATLPRGTELCVLVDFVTFSAGEIVYIASDSGDDTIWVARERERAQRAEVTGEPVDGWLPARYLALTAAGTSP